MGLSLRGQTSGAVDINAPAVAGDNTITLPDGNGSANQFYKNSTTAGIVTHSSMVEDSSGNVGINTITFPANGTNLKVSDGTISRLGLDKTGANARSFTIGNSGTILNVYDETADAERIRITSTGNIGIDSTSPTAKLSIGAGFNTTTASGYGIGNKITEVVNNRTGCIQLQADGFNNAYYPVLEIYNGTTRTAHFKADGNLVLQNGSGIDFSATTDGSGTTTSELFDDYEEGTWTPTGRLYSGTITVNSAYYVKVGDLVHVQMYIDFSNTADADSVIIEGLPFLAGGTNSAYSLLTAHTNSSLQDFAMRAQGTTDRLEAVTNNGSSGDTKPNYTSLAAKFIIMGGTYYAA